MTRTDLIHQYREAPADLAEALEGVSPEDADTARDGTWTVRQIVNHVADAELVTAVRIRRLLAEDHPLIPGFDEQQYTERLHNHARSVRSALALIRAIRDVNADLLEQVPEADWDREAVHAVTGPYTLGDWFAKAAANDHVRQHADQVRQAFSR